MRSLFASGLTMAVALGALVPMFPATSADEPATNCGTARWQGFIHEAATRSHMDRAWIDAVIRVESAGCETLEGKPTTSKAGAMGLMQLMPATWAAMRQRLSLGSDPYDPHDNILAGAEWLEELHERYGSIGFLAAYHAGPERYEDFLAGRQLLPDETINYIERIEQAYLGVNSKNTSVLADIRAARVPFVHPQHGAASVSAPFTRSPFVTLTRSDRRARQVDTTSLKQPDTELPEGAHYAR
jgi:soluble lytic murein transglycosylase-like protein